MELGMLGTGNATTLGRGPRDLWNVEVGRCLSHAVPVGYGDAKVGITEDMS